MYRQLSSDMQEEYVSLLTVYENLEAHICRNVITVIPTAKSMIDVAKAKADERPDILSIYPGLSRILL